MDWLTFISKMVEFLAWPVVALVLGLAFRQKLLELIPTIRRLKAGPLEAEFDKEARAVSAQAADVAPRAVTQPNEGVGLPPVADVVLKTMRTALADPSGAILEGWQTLDGELFRLLHQLDINRDPLLSTSKVFSETIESNILPEVLTKTVIKLRNLRNRVAHATVTPSVEAAQDYLIAVQNATEAIHKYRQTLPNYSTHLPLP